MGMAFSIQPVLASLNTNSKITSTPVYCIGVQHASDKRISFGIDYSIMQIVESRNNPSGGGTISYINTYHIPQINFRYHLNQLKTFDLYLEPKLVYVYKNYQVNFKYTGNGTSINSTAKIPITRNNSFNIQFCIGTNYRLNKNIQLNFEGALGLPYFMKLGMMFNLSNQNEDEGESKSRNKKSSNDDFVNPKSKNKMYR